MKTPKQSADELVERFMEENICYAYNGATEDSQERAAIQCAIISLEETMNVLAELIIPGHVSTGGILDRIEYLHNQREYLKSMNKGGKSKMRW